VSSETVKFLDALLGKAVKAGWVPIGVAEATMREVRGEKAPRKKKVKSPELGT